ncbi:helix-turn-helix transcriptional regulator [Sellimonas catena]|uniref:HTH cro/C1-type domain-containing protein n=1 Tax=Sellimonas catena TaxID=2994035 RepID=A0A9W6CD57_9FIRM|nr:helix-turn-helix transcriptional regulator [Sellimonas catena]GLG89127.1 hypothetical protein Selli2_05540 [Sellimonas catena]
MATTSERIREALEIRGMKQADLVEKTGIGKSSISTYISGSYEPKQRNLHKIAKALNVSEAWLMGLNVPMEKEKEWDVKTQEFEDKINAFYYQLRGLGWSCNWSDSEQLYTLTNGITSIKITSDEYSAFVEDSEEFYRRRLQKLFLQHSSLLNAAHARTDIDIPEDVDTSDNDIMDDENF